MLSIEDIRTRYSQLKELEDESAVQAGIEDIFFDLMYADQPLYIVVTGNRPYAAPATTDKRHIYVRLFSHKGVAEKFASRDDTFSVQEFSMTESLQLAKTSFMQGSYGYLLNEGDKWIGISFPTYLNLFFSRILNDNTLYSQECADVLSFLNELRKNNEFHYALLCNSDQAPVLKDNALFVSMSDLYTGDEAGSDSGIQLMPISLQSLFLLPNTAVHIKGFQTDFTTNSLMLVGGLHFLGYQQEKDAVLVSADYFNEPESMDSESSEDWKTNNLSIVFEPAQPAEEAVPADTDSPQESTPKKALSLTSIAAIFLSAKQAVLSKVSSLKKPSSEEPSDEVKIHEAEVIPTEVPKAEEENAIPEASVEDEAVPSEGDNESQKPSLKERLPKDPKKRKQITLIAIAVCCFALLICCVTGIVLVQKHQHQQKFEQFCSYVDNRDYGDAYILYTETNFGTKGDAYLSATLDTLVIGYANNELSAEELSASMQALANFPSMQQNLEVARLTAAKLEASKNAYVEGKETSDVYTKLNLWRQVLDLDSVNYAAVQQNVRDNQESYLTQLDKDIEYYSTRIRDFAKQRYEVIAYWYPESTITAKWADDYQTDNASPLSFYPVSISSLKIKQNPNSYWSLYIDWKNTSVKTIKEICFSVVALDENGDYLTCTDSAGSWTIFDAKDSAYGPYAPGEGPDSSNYQWTGVFYGPHVAKVKLTAVNIKFSDGSTASYTSDTDLARILS